MSMTIRERILSVYRGVRPDRLPTAIYQRYLPPGTAERQARNLGLGLLDFQPVVSLLAPPWHLLPGYVSEVKGVTFTVRLAWEAGERVETRTFETPVGNLSQQTVKDPAHGSDWIKKFYITAAEDYKVMQYIVEHTVFQRLDKAIARRREDLGEDGVVLGRVDRPAYQKLLIELAGPEQFLIDLQTQPQPVLELMAAMDARLDEQFAWALESPAEVLWQPDNVTADLTPPEAYARFLLPIYQKRGHLCERAGKRYVVHMDGKLRALQEGIAQSPFHALDSFSFPLMAGDMTVTEALRAWPSKTLCPNFPASLCDKPLAEIERFLEDVQREFGAHTPFLLQVSEDIPPGASHRIAPLLGAFG